MHALCRQGSSLPAPNRISSMSTHFPTRTRPAGGPASSPGPAEPSSSRARSIFWQSSVTPATIHSPRDRASVFALAFFVLIVIVGGAFAAGYLIGRILL